MPLRTVVFAQCTTIPRLNWWQTTNRSRTCPPFPSGMSSSKANNSNKTSQVTITSRLFVFLLFHLFHTFFLLPRYAPLISFVAFPGCRFSFFPHVFVRLSFRFTDISSLYFTVSLPCGALCILSDNITVTRFRSHGIFGIHCFIWTLVFWVSIKPLSAVVMRYLVFIFSLWLLFY